MLHIVNGDSVADKLRKAGLRDDILPWREVLSEGPVFADSAESVSRHARASYLEAVMGVPQTEYVRIAEEQEKQLDEYCRSGRDIVLWFEHDLFDQTMLCSLLHFLSSRAVENGIENGNRTTVYLLQIDRFPGIEPFHGLGQLTGEQLMSLAGSWREIGEAELLLGRAAWEAYCSPEPSDLLRLTERDLSALPFLRAALRFHLQRFPSTANGLGIAERTVLELLKDGVDAPFELFREAGKRLPLYGMGDLQFWPYLKRLLSGARPLIAVEDDVEFPSFGGTPASFAGVRFRLTADGTDVLAGLSDAVRLNGIDRWLGGAHLIGDRAAWRWDEAANTLVGVPL